MDRGDDAYVIDVYHCVGVTPGRRSYSRSTSAPLADSSTLLPDSSRGLLPLDSVASIDFPLASDKSDVTLETSSFDSLVGTLHYSSSSSE